MATTRRWPMQLRALAAAAVLALTAGWYAVSSPALAWADVSGTEPMYRMYNPYTGEHFYTAGVEEQQSLMNAGWIFEGVGWRAPETPGWPVYRLYNPYAGEHHFTLAAAERDSLADAGWVYEGIGWWSDEDEGIPVYREYNPNEPANNHNYTTDRSEHDWLVSLGWRDEGVAWCGSDVGVRPETFSGTVRPASSVGYPKTSSFFVLDFGEPMPVLGAGDWPDDFRLKEVPLDGMALLDDSTDWSDYLGMRITVETYPDAFRMPSGYSISNRIDADCHVASIVEGRA